MTRGVGIGSTFPLRPPVFGFCKRWQLRKLAAFSYCEPCVSVGTQMVDSYEQTGLPVGLQPKRLSALLNCNRRFELNLPSARIFHRSGGVSTARNLFPINRQIYQTLYFLGDGVRTSN